MGNDKEFIDVEPQAEYILYFWGLEPRSPNLAKVSLPSRSYEANNGDEKAKWNPTVAFASLKNFYFSLPHYRLVEWTGFGSLQKPLG